MAGLLAQLSNSNLSVSKAGADGKTHNYVSRYAAFATAAMIEGSIGPNSSTDRTQLWSNKGADWRTFGHVKRQFALQEGSATAPAIQAESLSPNTFALSFDGHAKTDLKIVSVCLTGAAMDLVLEIDGRRCKGVVSKYSNASRATVLDVWIEDCMNEESSHAQFLIPFTDYGTKGSAAGGKPVVVSPMPGKVVKVLATDGQIVKTGDVVVIIEAMKMEHVILAPSDGLVIAVV